MTVADKILHFLFHLQLPFSLPKNIQTLDAHKNIEVQKVCISFYKKFYADNKKRYMLLGINPGRFGGGVTGIPFTDPIRLEKICGIKNDFLKKQELSSVFMYEMMEAFGGVEKFYHQFYISATSPLGFVKDGKNLNYYDDKLLMKNIEPFVIDCLKKQLLFGIEKEVCFCIGEGENYKYLLQLNEKYKFFKSLKALPHPRFIMQYKLKQKEKYIQQYFEILSLNNL
ncbi:MAG: uracil-DNA glycosylase family protein [Chitinophagaceae bacterium]